MLNSIRNFGIFQFENCLLFCCSKIHYLETFEVAHCIPIEIFKFSHAFGTNLFGACAIILSQLLKGVETFILKLCRNICLKMLAF